jgi:UDP-galactopyranose mutase
VLAERLAAGSNKKVLICDKRSHIGGNAYDHYNDAGILVHKYGPHIFTPIRGKSSNTFQGLPNGDRINTVFARV